MRPAQERLTERRNPASIGIDRKSIPEMLRIFHEEDRKAVAAVEAVAEAVAEAIEWVEAAFRRGGRLFYVGSGTSGRLGVLDASECPPTFGVSPERVVGIIAGGDVALRRSIEAAEDDAEAGAEAIRTYRIDERDVVVGITTSGRTPYVLGALREAHRRGARTVLLSCTPPESELGAFVDGFITPLVGPEIIAGSTRLKAGTATKLILNQITTIAMIRIGKVYDNWMVDVQATNSKLRERARRMVAEIAGVDAETAQRALNAASGDTKVAILMLSGEMDAEEARQVLAAHGDSLRAALRAAGKVDRAHPFS